VDTAAPRWLPDAAVAWAQTLRQRARWSQVPQTGASPALLSSLLLTGLDHLEQHALTPGAEPVLQVEQPAHHDDIQRQYGQEARRQMADQLLNHQDDNVMGFWFFGISLFATIFLISPWFVFMALPYILTALCVLLPLICVFDYLSLRR
jgi:hypothetical protein